MRNYILRKDTYETRFLILILLNRNLKRKGIGISIFVMIVAVLAILMIFDVISVDTLKESSAKLAGAITVLIAASVAVALIQEKRP